MSYLLERRAPLAVVFTLIVGTISGTAQSQTLSMDWVRPLNASVHAVAVSTSTAAPGAVTGGVYPSSPPSAFHCRYSAASITKQGNPLLERSVRHRFPYLDPLNHVQVELLKEHRAQNPDEQILRGIQLTINGISAGLRNTG